MSSGPTKENLENYWKTSRAYFDELAKYYETADPEYYREFIAPFYSNPLYSVSGSKRSPLPMVILSVAILFIGLLAAGVFFFLQFEDDKTIQEDTPKMEKNADKEQINKYSDTVKTEKEIDPGKLRNRKQPIKRVR